MMTALYTGASGLKSLGTGMQTVSNNLANMNTVGYKAKYTLYEDVYNESLTSQSNGITNMSQLGLGSRANYNKTLFNQGGIEPGSAATDIAINGGGYFGVMKDGEMHYTRAGNMRFTNEGALIDPMGYTLQGFPITNGVVGGTPTDIKLDMSSGSLVSSAYKPTSSMTVISNLGTTVDASNDPANPFFSLTSSWDGTSTPPIGSGDYSYTASTKIYDSNGKAHTANIYYDYIGTNNGNKAYEYVVAIDPSEDGGAFAGTASAGLLMSGTMNFNSTGQLVGMTAYKPTSADPSNLSAWQQASLNNGFPELDVTFAGAGSQSIALNLGGQMTSGWGPGTSTPADAATNPADFYASTPGLTRDKSSSTAYAGSNSTLSPSQNGYPEGQIANLKVGADGTVSAVYSNGMTKDLYQIAMYRFASQDGLEQVGGNHYIAGKDAGVVEVGIAGTENYGNVISYSLEASNVDMSTEFTTMIITQRGFQMNSKVVSTADAMLQKAIEIKR